MACGTSFWREFPRLHLLCCPAAAMMLTADVRTRDLTKPNMWFSAGGGPLTPRQRNRIYFFHLTSYRTSVSSRQLVMFECAALNVSGIRACHRGHRRARHAHGDSLAAERDQLCLANGMARLGTVWASPRWNTHSSSFVQTWNFGLALVSARFCRPATDTELKAFGLSDLWPLLRGHSRFKPPLSRHYWNKIIWQVTRRVLGEVYQVKCSLMPRCLRCNWKIYTTSCSNLAFRRQAGMRVIGPLIKSVSGSEWQVPPVHRSKGVKLLIGAENREST